MAQKMLLWILSAKTVFIYIYMKFNFSLLWHKKAHINLSLRFSFQTLFLRFYWQKLLLQ